MQGKESPSYEIVRSRDDLAPSLREKSPANLFVIEESLGYLVNYLAKQFAQLHTLCLARHGVLLGQWGVLMFLWVEDGLTQRELSRQVAIDEASMVRALDRMERDGLVKRVRNERDRRQINVFLTEKGRTLRDDLIPCAIAGNAVATQGFTQSELDLLLNLLGRMSASLEEALAGQEERM